MKTMDQLAKSEEFSLYHYLKKNWKNILILAFIVLLVIIYWWHNMTLSRLEKNDAEKYNNLYNASVSFSNRQNNKYLQLVAHSFSLAIISEINRNNYENVDLYSKSLLKKDDRIIEILISNTEGIIFSSTNKKHENNMLKDYYPYKYEQMKYMVVTLADKERNLLIITPMYIYNELKGIVIIKYKPELFSF